MTHFRAGVLLLALSTTLPAASIQADSRRGAELLRTQGCSNCHTIDGSGGVGSAPDLTRRTAREYSAAGMASRIWNHAPNMWSAMNTAGVAVPKLSPGDSADLLAFFYAARFFENPGDASRGKQLFNEKHCSSCHGLSGNADNSTGAKPVSEWTDLADPVQLVQRMWVHSADMRQAVANRKWKWPNISGQELTDILVYVQNMPANRHLPYHFALPSGTEGKQLFESKGCANCHTGALSLDERLKNKTLTNVAAAMWNHSPRMTGNVPAINPNEMRQIVVDIWARQFFEAAGDRAKGQKVYESKCASCHASGGAPKIPTDQTAVTMISNLWLHGPTMLAQIRKSGGTWPTLTPEDMTNLVAYFDSH
jgi:mono/diheme cytochrome c family protein